MLYAVAMGQIIISDIWIERRFTKRLRLAQVNLHSAAAKSWSVYVRV